MSDEFKHNIRLLIENFYYSNLIKNKKLKNVYSDWCRNNDNFSIMSFNLKTDKHYDGEFSWMYRKNLCSNVIKMYCPDIISFQEVNPHMHKFMVSELYEVYNHYSADRKNGKDVAPMLSAYEDASCRQRHRCRFGHDVLGNSRKNCV